MRRIIYRKVALKLGATFIIGGEEMRKYVPEIIAGIGILIVVGCIVYLIMSHADVAGYIRGIH